MCSDDCALPKSETFPNQKMGLSKAGQVKLEQGRAEKARAGKADRQKDRRNNKPEEKREEGVNFFVIHHQISNTVSLKNHLTRQCMSR